MRPIMLKLHHHPLSTFSRRVRIALLEKGLAAELVEVDMPARAHRSPSSSPSTRTAASRSSRTTGWCSTSRRPSSSTSRPTHPAPPLVPEDARGRALCSMHMKLCDLQLGAEGGALIFPARFLPRERWDEAAMAKARKRIETHLGIVETQLAGREYLVGDRYSLVEVCYTPLVEFLPLVGITPPPAVAAWIERMMARPSALATKPAR